MAIKSQKVLPDTPSMEVELLRQQLNNLLTALDGAANFAALQTALAVGGSAEASTIDLVPSPMPLRTPKFPA